MAHGKKSNVKTGRFAPSPSGRMHLGNIATALVSWLSVRHDGGRWILRIEDLDPDRSKYDFARLIEDDLEWLGLTHDEGGLADLGDHGPYSQSRRGDIYNLAFEKLRQSGMIYPCRCTRADILASRAPHASDGRVVYGGKCRPAKMPFKGGSPLQLEKAAMRLFVPDKEFEFTDKLFGTQRENLSRECGDFIIRRADGAWAYQLAVAVDDALMGMTEVVRGHDLLSSTPQQLYIMELLGLPSPEYMHLPIVCNKEGIRLSKRDKALSMEELRKKFRPEELIGLLGALIGLLPHAEPIGAEELAEMFDVTNIRKCDSLILPDSLSD